MRKTLFLCWATLLVSLTSCELNSPDYTADMLLPLLKTKIKPEDVNELGDIVFVQDVAFPDVSHLIDPAFPIPAIPNPLLPIPGVIGPIDLVDLEDSFVRAKVDTAEYELTITNNFPINIKAGTKVVITNSTNTDTVFIATIPNTIAPNGGQEVIKLFLSETSPWFDNDLRLYLVNFSTDGSGNDIVNFANSTIRLRFKIDLLTINEVEISQGKRYHLHDTVDFQLQEPESTTNLSEGKLTLYLTNGFPASYYFQGYFMNEQYQVIDSLLEISDVPAPELNNQGYVIPSSVKEVKITTTWTREELARLRNEARYLSFRARFEVPSPAILPPAQTVKLRHENQVFLQLVGDLKVEVKPQ